MANRLVSNVYIIDSALGNVVTLPMGDVSNPGKFRIASVGFSANDTTAAVQIAVGNSANIVINYGYLGGSGLLPKMQIDQLGGVEWAGPIYVPTVTAGTAYLYLI